MSATKRKKPSGVAATAAVGQVEAGPATKRGPVMVRDASAVHRCPQCGHSAPIRLDDLFPEREQPKGQTR